VAQAAIARVRGLRRSYKVSSFGVGFAPMSVSGTPGFDAQRVDQGIACLLLTNIKQRGVF